MLMSAEGEVLLAPDEGLPGDSQQQFLLLSLQLSLSEADRDSITEFCSKR